ncbi:MAG TPA: methyltransferase domain-containing protein [Pseudolabrys sp.]|jgi:SAM-dependent methyltransferase
MRINSTAGQLLPNLSHRSTEVEWLDGAGPDAPELEFFLRDLSRFNGAMLGHRAVMAWLRRITKHAPKEPPLTLVDIGCGNGDLLRTIRWWSRRHGLPIRLIGLDRSRETIRIAQAASARGDGIEYRVGNVFEFTPPEPIDFVVSSLFAHHLSDDMIVEFLGWMESTARRGWLIYDLQRHAVPHCFITLIGKLTRLHPLMIEDGRISVARALTAPEWRERMAAAGIPPGAAQLRWFLFRFVIGRMK